MSSNTNELKLWKNVDFGTWEYKPQTQKKHRVLEDYFRLWLMILGSSYSRSRVRYIDGFGGAGAYHTEDDIKKKMYSSNSLGSPAIFMKVVKELQDEGKMKLPPIEVIIIDKSEECIENMKKVLKSYNLGEGIDCSYINKDFSSAINNDLKFIFEEEETIPTLFLLDPFGVSQIEMNTVKKIMSLKKSEIILNFMYNFIRRFATAKKIEPRMTALYGDESWKECLNSAKYKKTREKERMLIYLFRKKCKQFSDFVFPYPFFFSDKNLSFYYLFHLSNHIYACGKMKEVFAANNQGRLEGYYDTGQTNISENIPREERGDFCPYCFMFGEDIRFQSKCSICLMVYLKEKRTIIYREMTKDIFDSIPITEQQFKNSLKILEKAGKIKVTAGDNRKRRDGFRNCDIIEVVSTVR